MRPDIPSLTALLAFEASLRHESFTRAGVELGRTQGAISRQVALLESQLGVVLFERDGARLRPSSTARSFGAKLSLLLDRLAALTVEAQTTGSIGSSLQLAILPTFGTRWLIPRIPAFYERHPEVRVNLSTRIGIFDFEATTFDAAIHHGGPHWPGAELEPLMREEVLVVCTPELAARIASPEDLLRHPLLQLESRRRAWSHWFERFEVDAPPKIAGPLFEHHLMVTQAALAGLGVALLPTFLIEEELRAGTLVSPFPDRLVRGHNAYYLAYPPAHRRLPALISFREWLFEALPGERLA